MVTLVLVKNPFNPQDGRKVIQIEPGGTLADLLEQHRIEGVELCATVNGFSVDEGTEIRDGDFVVIYPAVEKGGKSGKSILGIVAAIALSVVSFGIASGGWLAGLGTAFKAGMWGAYAAAAAVMFVGSSLMGRFMGQKVDNGSYGEKEDPTYSWGQVTTMEGQNNPVALTYGKVKSGGQTIGKYVLDEDNQEYLNWLVACGEGPLNITDIKLNDNDIENFEEVSYEIRNGENDQTVISYFNDTFYTKNLSYRLGTDWSEDSAQGTDTGGLIFDIDFPNGLYHANDKGEIKSAWVTLACEYRRDNGDGTYGDWTNLFTAVSENDYGVSLKQNIAAGNYTLKLTPRLSSWWSDDTEYEDFDGVTIRVGTASTTVKESNFGKKSVDVGSFRVNTAAWPNATKTALRNGETITATVTVVAGSEPGTVTASQRSAVRKQYRINKLASGAYKVRVRLVDRQYPEDDVQSCSDCYWTAVTSVIYDDFCYPCTALIGIRALATDQLNGSPALTFMKERTKVWVWNGSGYVQKNASNPAWACYDLLHQARKLRNIHTGEDEMEVRGVPAGRMRYADFYRWAAWLDIMHLYVNIEIIASGEMLDIANQKLASVGRGMVVRFGTRYGCIYDHVQDPVQMFGMGNIKAGTFSEEFLKVADRANCVEVTFTNADADYERDVLTIYGDTFDTDGYAKTAQLTLDGITSYEQAYREGKYQLMCNKYQLRTVSFEADIDAIACTVGDVIFVSHDVPKWAVSGRIDKAGEGIIDVVPNGKVMFNGNSNCLLPVPNTVVCGINNGDPAEAYSKDVPATEFAEILQLGGKTIVWNQLVDTGTTSLTLSNGHKYYTQISGTANIVEGDGTAITVTGGSDMVCDLTRMFGTGSEPETVKEFFAIFPNADVTYDAGTLVHGGVTEVESVGKNLADPGVFFRAISQAVLVEDEEGDYWKCLMSHMYSNFRSDLSTNKSPVFTQGYLTLSCDIRIDLSAEIPASAPRFHIGFTNMLTRAFVKRASVYPTEEWQHISVSIENNGKCRLAATYSNNVRINIRNFQIEAGDVETPFEAYRSGTYTVPAAVTALEGYGWSAGSAYNYIDYERKKFVKCVDRVDLGTLTWSYTSSNGGRFYSTSLTGVVKPNPDGQDVVTNLLCKEYQTISYKSILTGTYDKVIALGTSSASSEQRNVQLRDTSTNTTVPADFKAAMSGVYLYYELLTPVETDVSGLLSAMCLLPCELGSGWENNSYMLQWRSVDDTLHSKACTVVSSVDGWTQAVVQGPDVPQAGDVFDIAVSGTGSKPFVVKSITRAQDFTRRIACIEYAESLYDESYEIPPIQYATRAIKAAKNVTKLSASQYQYTDSNRVRHGVMSVSWKRASSGGTYTVLLSTDNKKWTAAVSGTSNVAVEFTVKAKTSYYVKVITVLGVSQSGGVTTGPVDPGQDIPPSAVTGLAGAVDPADRTQALLTWDANNDIDFNHYEVSFNGKCYRTSSNKMRITSAVSNPVVSVVAVDNAGNRSAGVSLTVSISAFPSDVTGFRMAQQATDRSVLEFTWNAVTDTDLSQYELRYGNTWEGGTRFEQTKTHKTTLQVTEGGVYTFWIAAINAAGNYSSSPASITRDISIVPSDVTGFTVTQQATDRSVLEFTWNAVTDTDLAQYELRYGNTWGEGIRFAQTRTHKTTLRLTTGGNYTFWIAAINAAGYYSALPTGVTKTISIVPSNVTGFSLKQQTTDRSVLEFSWNAVTDADLAQYEIRLGSKWSSGSMVAKSKTLSATYQITESGSYTFWIAAMNVAGVYSASPAKLKRTIDIVPSAVTDLTAAQSTKDHSRAVISFTRSPGKDIDHYTIKYGNTWDNGTLIIETKENKVEWQVPASGTYNIMVQAVTVAGQISAVANTGITITIEPLDVVNFRAVQSTTDKTSVLLSWDAVNQTDVAYYIVRQGTSWDTAAIIGPRVSGTTFEVRIAEERQFTWMVKAVTIAGNESQYPAVASEIFGLEPTPVDTIQLRQNPKDRSQLTIQWSAVPDGDLVGYQVKVGDNWDSAEEIPLTNELYASYTLTETESVHVMIRTLNSAGFYSDEKSASLRCTVEPTNCTNFVAYQDGETVELYWTVSTDVDVTGYEIREGSHFDTGMLVATGVTNNFFTVPVDMERLYEFHIVAINKAGFRSATARTARVNVENLPPKNVIQTFDEMTRQSGTHSSTEFGESSINFQTVGGHFSDYTTTRFADLGGAQVLKLKLNTTTGKYPASGTYTLAKINVGSIITAKISVYFVSTVMYTGDVSAVLQFRTSLDNSTWMAWMEFKPVQRRFRYLQFRVKLATKDTGKTPEVNHLLISIDVPDTDIAITAAIAAGGTTVPYGHTFYAVPNVTASAIGETVHARVISRTKTQCVIKVFNTANTDVGGTADIKIKGY